MHVQFETFVELCSIKKQQQHMFRYIYTVYIKHHILHVDTIMNLLFYRSFVSRPVLYSHLFYTLQLFKVCISPFFRFRQIKAVFIHISMTVWITPIKSFHTERNSFIGDISLNQNIFRMESKHSEYRL